MYHDQGLIPVKLLGFDRAVNTTIGLSIVRTSPDHGTAFNISGKNTASPNSMKAAIELAVKLAHAKFAQAAHAKDDPKDHAMKEQAAKDAALDALGFEDTEAE